MPDEATDGVSRLGKSGVGVVVGGLLLAVLGSSLSVGPAAGVVFVVGVAGMVASDTPARIQQSLGIAAVGAIGLLEAIPGVGLGLTAGTLAVVAIAFGLFDIVASALLRRVQARS